MEHENLADFLKSTNFAERGFNDFRSLKSALKILETIAKAVKKLPIGPGTVERLADNEELQPYIVNAIDDVINVTHEDMCHIVTVQFGENAYLVDRVQQLARSKHWLNTDSFRRPG